MNIDTAMILSGGLGTRFKEYTKDIPKPMIKANGQPLLIHIINFYKSYGVKNIIVLAGYKIENIHDYFKTNGNQLFSDENTYSFNEEMKIKIVDTGKDTMTGGRIKKGFKYVKNNFSYLTYGDGIANVDLMKLKDFHKKFSPIVTLTAVRPPARFGSLDIENEKVIAFNEKKQANEGWINGGFFILDKTVVNYIDNDNQSFEKEPLSKLSKENKLNAYKHNGLFRPVDTIRELEILERELENNDFDF